MTSVRKPTPDFDPERDLRDFPVPPAPKGLAEKIRLEIPSGEELAAAANAEGDGLSRRTPWLRLAATLALAALAGTVAWQTMRSKDLAPSESATSLREETDLAQPQSAPPPPPTAAAESSRSAEEKLPVKGRERTDLAKDIPSATPSPESFSRRELENAALAQPAAQSGGSHTTGDRATGIGAEERKDGVEGGVAGGVAGGVVGATPSAAAAAAPASPAEIQARQEAYEVQYEQEMRRRAPISPIGEAGQVDVRSQPKASMPKPAASKAQGYYGRELERPQSPQPDTMIFRDAGVNRFVRTADDALSTFAIDVDTGSYTLARSYLERGVMPPPEAIRLEEFVNAMSYSDPAPRPGSRDDFALYAEGADSPYPDAAGLKLLRFAVKAREVDVRDRKPANLTFVVDVSGSMDRENRLELVKRALGLLLDELTGEDRVGLVVYGTEGRILLHPTRDHAAIRRAIAELRPEGSTNAEAGLRLGYDLADEAWTKGEINRIILCSDGVANVGATGPEAILARIGEQARRGIQLTTVGFGMGNYNDALMERLANQGDGTYHYVDQLDEARKVFVENLTGTLQNVAKDAKIQVAFDPRTVERWRLLGYENRDVADRDFRNDAVDAGEVGAGQAATALYEVRLRDGVRPNDRVATLQVRWKSVDGKPAGEVRETARELRAGDVARSLDRGNGDLRLAAAAAVFAEKLKGTRAGVEFSWSGLLDHVDLLDGASANELRTLVERAARLAGAERDRERHLAPDRDEDERREPNGRLDEPR